MIFCFQFTERHVCHRINTICELLYRVGPITRVIAYNRVGASDPSPISEFMCATTTCRPRTNPVGVRAYTTQFFPLLIEWDSMPPIKWNAPKFWYEIGWRPFVVGANPEPFMTQRVYPPQNQFPIPNPVLNMRYQYYVKAVNQQPGGLTLSLWIFLFDKKRNFFL